MIFAGGGAAAALDAAFLVDMRVTFRIDGDGTFWAYRTAMMCQTASAEARHDVPGLRAFITGDVHNLYGILASMIFSQTNANPLRDDRTILIDAAAARRLALFDDRVRDIIKRHEGISACPGLSRQLAQNLVFDDIHAALKNLLLCHVSSPF